MNHVSLFNCVCQGSVKPNAHTANKTIAFSRSTSTSTAYRSWHNFKSGEVPFRCSTLRPCYSSQNRRVWHCREKENWVTEGFFFFFAVHRPTPCCKEAIVIHRTPFILGVRELLQLSNACHDLSVRHVNGDAHFLTVWIALSNLRFSIGSFLGWFLRDAETLTHRRNGRNIAVFGHTLWWRLYSQHPPCHSRNTYFICENRAQWVPGHPRIWRFPYHTAPSTGLPRPMAPASSKWISFSSRFHPPPCCSCSSHWSLESYLYPWLLFTFTKVRWKSARFRGPRRSTNATTAAPKPPKGSRWSDSALWWDRGNGHPPQSRGVNLTHRLRMTPMLHPSRRTNQKRTHDTRDRQMIRTCWNLSRCLDNAIPRSI